MKAITASKSTQWFLTLGKDGFIQGCCEAWPPQELKPNQVAITREEFDFLNKTGVSLIKARSIIRSIEKKIQRSKR